MNKGKNILTMLGFIIITCGQLYGLSPRQLARLRNLENQFNTRLEQGPGENFGAWRAGMQGQVDRMRQIDRPTADYYQRIVQRLGEGEAVREERIGEMKGMEEERIKLEAQLAAMKAQLAEKDDTLAAYKAELAAREEARVAREREQERAFAAHLERINDLYRNVIAVIDRVQTAMRSDTVEFTDKQPNQLKDYVEQFSNNLGTADNLADIFKNLSAGAQSNFQYESYQLMGRLNRNFNEIADNTDTFINSLEKLSKGNNHRREDFDKAVHFLQVMYTINSLFSHLLNMFAGILQDTQLAEITTNFHQQQNKLDALKNKLYAIFNVSPARRPGNILIHFFGMEEGENKAKTAIIPDPFPAEVIPEEESKEAAAATGGYTRLPSGAWVKTVK